jgi:aryl sulfotransferase
MTSSPSLPRKTREIKNNHMDSTIWNDFEFRSDDIIIGTYAKSGTTWMQQIVSQLVFQGEEGLNVPELSPWLDFRLPPQEVKFEALAAQTHRRFIKTHLPLDAFVFRPEIKHIYIARDGRDVLWSMHNHHLNITPEIIDALNSAPGLEGPKFAPTTDDTPTYFRKWLNDEGFPPWSFWENIRTWWAVRDLPNVKLVHFNDLKADMEREIRTLAAFLEIDVPAEKWPLIMDHCSFKYMKGHADKMAPLGGAPWQGGGKTFINKGTNQRWRDALTADDLARYEQRGLDELGAECFAWVKNGKQR